MWTFKREYRVLLSISKVCIAWLIRGRSKCLFRQCLLSVHLFLDKVVSSRPSHLFYSWGFRPLCHRHPSLRDNTPLISFAVLFPLAGFVFVVLGRRAFRARTGNRGAHFAGSEGPCHPPPIIVLRPWKAQARLRLIDIGPLGLKHARRVPGTAVDVSLRRRLGTRERRVAVAVSPLPPPTFR